MTTNPAADSPPSDDLALARADVLAGRAAPAIERLMRLLEGDGFSPELYYWLSAAYGSAGRRSDQAEALRKAEVYHGLQIIKDSGGDLIRFQQDPAYAAAVAGEFYAADLIACASLGYGRAAMEPSVAAEVLLSYGLSLQHQGRSEDATDLFHVAVGLHPSPRANDFLLEAVTFAEGGAVRYADEARRWAGRFAPRFDPAALAFANSPDNDRRLKIGYLAPDFVGPEIAPSIGPVLDAHDARVVEVFLYPGVAAGGAGARGEHVRFIGETPAAEAAALIKGDGIDVLIDLWGHRPGGRLDVMALKPAPVQASWTAEALTTGLAAVDYVLMSDAQAACANPDLFTETPWPLGAALAPFRLAAGAAPTQTAAIRNGYVTFGALGDPARLSDQTVQGWARALATCQHSKLLFSYAFFADPILQNATCARFAAHGVDPLRLEFRGQNDEPPFADVDLVLDPSPCSGGPAMWEALANGVPVLALRGADSRGLAGAGALELLGLGELVAETWDDFAVRARLLTADPAALDALRAKVRPAFDASPVRDEAGFTRALEAAFRAMFSRWRERD